MIQKIKEWGGVVALVAIILVFAFMGKTPSNVGGIGTRYPNGLGVGSGTMSIQTGFLQASSTFQSSGVIQAFGGTKIGVTGTNTGTLDSGLCYIYPYASTIVASSTVTVDCQATAAAGTAGAIAALVGVQPNDFVQASLSTTTQGTIAIGTGGLVLAGASASTTAGYITLRITNLTGTTYTWPTTGAATGTAYYLTTRP